MTLQDVTLSIVDGALGLLPAETDQIVLVVGTSSGGTPNTVYPVNSADALATLGYGPGPEALKHLIDQGALCYFVPCTQGTVGVNSAVAQPSGSPPAVALTGVPFDTYSGIVTMTLGGAVGTSKFKYSLDGGNTYSSDILTASTYPIPNTGITITFAAGTYVLADSYTFTSTAPYYTTTNLGTALDAAIADPREWGLVYVVGIPTGASEALSATATAGVVSAVASKMTAAATGYRFARAIMEANAFADTGTALISAAASIAQSRIAVVAGTGLVLSPLTGRKNTVNIARVAVSKLGKKPIGKDPSQVEDGDGVGPLPSALISLVHDERKTPGLDTARFVTARTYVGRTGFYLTNFPLMSAPGSDFKYLQHGQIIDNASKVCRNALLDYLSADLDVNENGTLDEGQAQSIEEDVGGQVRASLVAPGHASAVTIAANRTDDVLTTERLRVSLRVQPKFYPKTIAVDLGFTKLVAEAT